MGSRGPVGFSYNRRNLVYAYVQAFTEQILLSGACNGAHSLKERLARWLLMMRDRDEDVLREPKAIGLFCRLRTD